MSAKLLRIAFSIAVGAMPLVWLGLARWRGIRFDRTYWLIACGLTISAVADLLGTFMPRRLTNDTYMMVQSGFIGMTLMDREDGLAFFGMLFLSAALSPLVVPMGEINHLVSTVGSLGLVCAVWLRVLPEPLKASLLILFGATWVAWDLVYAWYPSTEASWVYQGARLMGSVVLCLAAMEPNQRLKIA